MTSHRPSVDNKTPTPGGGRPIRFSVIPFILIGATLAAYWPILGNEFVSLDDAATIYANLKLTRLSMTSIYSFWTAPQLNLYAPITYTLFALIAAFSRVHSPAGSPAIPFYPAPFHAVSLLLHVVNGLIVYRLLRRCALKEWPAGVGAMVFALHPAQVESVAWATEMNGLLCAMFSLTAVLFYLRSLDRRLPQAGRQAGGNAPIVQGNEQETARAAQALKRQSRGWYLLASEIFLLALLSKPLGVIVPVLGGIMCWLTRARPDLVDALSSPLDNVPRRRHTYFPVPARLAGWLAMAFPIGILAMNVQPVPRDWLVVPLWFRPFVVGDTLAFYVYKVLFPITLVPDYARPPALIQHRAAGYLTWLVPAAIAVLLALLWRRWRGGEGEAGAASRTPLLIAGALWFMAAMLPVLGFTLFAFEALSTAADRYLYLPMFGVALMVAALLDGAWAAAARRGASARLGVRLIPVAILIALGARTRLQTHYWHDTQTLFNHTIEVTGREPGTRRN